MNQAIRKQWQVLHDQSIELALAATRNEDPAAALKYATVAGIAFDKMLRLAGAAWDDFL